jgi:hypothetical protein
MEVTFETEDDGFETIETTDATPEELELAFTGLQREIQELKAFRRDLLAALTAAGFGVAHDGEFFVKDVNKAAAFVETERAAS